MPKYVNADNLLFEIKTGWWPQSTEYTNAIWILERMLTDAPAEDVEPVVHAHWIVPDENYPDTCSNCLFEFVWDGDEGYHPKRCPNCGAHMDEEASE